MRFCSALAFRNYKLIDFSYRLDSHEGAANAIVQLQGANMGGRPVKVRRWIDLAAYLCVPFHLTG
jgi:hypothetical protein